MVNLSYPPARRHRPGPPPDHLIPIPGLIAMDLEFLPPRLSPRQFELAVRASARRHLVPLRHGALRPGPIEIYDARVWRVIHEVISES